MRTIIKISTFIILATIASFVKAQQTAQICAGSSATITAINSQGLSNPSYSLNPGGLTSSTPTFVVAPAFATTYTMYVTGTNNNSALVTTINTVTVQVSGVSYSLTSPNAFSLGCSTFSVCTVNIINASAAMMMNGTAVPTGGPVSYTFLPPGSSTVLAPTGTLNSISVTTVITPGTLTVVVRDNTNFCTSWGTVNISANVAPPVISSVAVSYNPLTCSNSSAMVQIAADPSMQFSWLSSAAPSLPAVAGNGMIVNSIPTAPSQTIATTLTLVVNDVNNGCQSTTTIPVYQNLFEPNAAISGPAPFTCQNPVVLTNVSTTGIPPGTFPNALPVVAVLWMGAPPQVSVATLTNTYIAQSAGIHMMSAKDMNNGCAKTATYYVSPSAAAAFAHTVTNGQATFNDMSTGTGTSTTYFWDFGDGNSSTQQNPSHTYSSGGAHLVKLKITNAVSLCTDSVIQSVNVSGIPCIANSGFSMVPTSTAQLWSIVPDYPWNVTAATWGWGDGSSTNTLYTSHQYSAAGMYNICLSVTVSCVASSSTCTSYSVYRTTQSALIYEVQVTAPQLISGINSSEAEALFSWNILPNPNAGDFILQLDNARAETIRVVIRDITGRMVQSHSFEGHPNRVSVPAGDLPAGMYLVSLETGSLKATKRMVVSH